ncbi:SMI1/KNR4 family protein [Nonomuraea sp. NPDC005650]|uniref:SMI1/KNR4 family protein n=1 Tax=Nonomuraea sp. NPDC005650 TaxID=3157045 RepID=UPI0033A2D80E
MAGMEAIKRLMPPPVGGGLSVDWARLAESWGKKGFPSDYVDFIQTYGGGAVHDFLAVISPEPKGGDPVTDGMLNETWNAEALWAESTYAWQKSAELANATPELITWGVDATADLLCWDAAGDDPESWPVIVWNRGDDLWRRYDCGMVEFLTRTLRADFDECPLNGLFIWGVSPVDFKPERPRSR